MLIVIAVVDTTGSHRVHAGIAIAALILTAITSIAFVLSPGHSRRGRAAPPYCATASREHYLGYGDKFDNFVDGLIREGEAAG